MRVMAAPARRVKIIRTVRPLSPPLRGARGFCPEHAPRVPNEPEHASKATRKRRLETKCPLFLQSALYCAGRKGGERM